MPCWGLDTICAWWARPQVFRWVHLTIEHLFLLFSVHMMLIYVIQNMSWWNAYPCTFFDWKLVTLIYPYLFRYYISYLVNKNDHTSKFHYLLANNIGHPSDSYGSIKVGFTLWSIYLLSVHSIACIAIIHCGSRTEKIPYQNFLHYQVITLLVCCLRKYNLVPIS